MTDKPLQPGDIEVELGVPLPGPILPPEQWARTGIKRLPPPGPLDWPAIFGRSAPLVFDLGCGNGRFLVSSAVRRPSHDHVGIDALPMVIRYATRRANQRGLTNARLLVAGADAFLADYVAPHSVQEIHLYHPQPYHDPARRERRLLTPEFLASVWTCLASDGLFVLQTDERAYWEYLCRIVPEFFLMQVQETPWPDAPQGRTRREIQARAQGLKIYRATAAPRGDRSPAEFPALVRSLPRPEFSTTRGRSAPPQSRRRLPPAQNAN